MVDQLPTVFGDSGGLEVTPVMIFGADGQPTSDGQQYWETSGTISGAGQQVELVCPGAGSAVVAIEGTFVGTLGAYRRDSSLTNGDAPAQIIFAGSGGTGINQFALSGTYDLEWRVTAGGYAVIVRAGAWTSGTATIRIAASPAATATFINGAVMQREEQSVRSGRAFVASTPSVSITGGNYLHCKLVNPANSGRNLFLTKRRFTNTGTNVLVYQAFVNPTANPSTAGVVPNRKIGAAVATATFSYEQNTNGTFFGALTGSTEAIPAGGVVSSREVLVEVPPGFSLGFTVAGSGGVGASGNVTAVLEFYEEPVA